MMMVITGEHADWCTAEVTAHGTGCWAMWASWTLAGVASSCYGPSAFSVILATSSTHNAL
jgi:hypothetical protein